MSGLERNYILSDGMFASYLLENNEVSRQLRANHFLILITFLYTVEKKVFITRKQTLIKDVLKEWNMEWLAERIERR